MHYRILLCCLFSIPVAAGSQNPYVNIHSDIDILHYIFRIQLNDTTDRIEGEATIRVLFRNEKDADFTLDLVGPKHGKGMTVSSVNRDREVLSFRHEADVLRIVLPSPPPKGVPQLITIRYSGVPADGLYIAANKYGERTFFADHWPNRGHHWLPLVDHPSDKATCEWIVTAPGHYRVIGNGALREEKDLGDGLRRTHWSEFTPIPPKVMVIGVARFAVRQAGVVDDVEVSSWVYPKDSAKSFLDYQPAVPILRYFEERLGDYVFEKLASVQSTTIFGGMENASNIFYPESSVFGFDYPDFIKTQAHEVAHQWFGNSVTETNYSHLWLSEGFATYLAADYMKYRYGQDFFNQLMMSDRETVLGFIRQSPVVPAVVDSTQADLLNLLNANSYQKGGWFLYMLHREVGEEAFWKGLRTFFARYRNSNAATPDFQSVMEQISGQKLDAFFRQWLYVPGVPVLRATWKYKSGSRNLLIKLKQTSGYLYDIPLEIGFFTQSNVLEKTTALRVNKKKSTFRLASDTPPAQLRLDPHIHLLADMEITQK